jgi:hypothetical protein
LATDDANKEFPSTARYVSHYIRLEKFHIFTVRSYQQRSNPNICIISAMVGCDTTRSQLCFMDKDFKLVNPLGEDIDGEDLTNVATLTAIKLTGQ